MAASAKSYSLRAFIAEECTVAPPLTCSSEDIFRAWAIWCDRHGKAIGTVQSFGRELRAVVPSLHVTQPRVGGIQVRHYAGIGLGKEQSVHPYSDIADRKTDEQTEISLAEAIQSVEDDWVKIDCARRILEAIDSAGGDTINQIAAVRRLAAVWLREANPMATVDDF